MESQNFMGRNQLINRLTDQVGSREMALGILEKRGHIFPGTNKLTITGKIRDDMTAEERALDRAARESGKPISSFTYDPVTNSTKLI